MYEELFKRNKAALEFLKKKENLTAAQSKQLIPISMTELRSKTIVGIAELMTEFANEVNKTTHTCRYCGGDNIEVSDIQISLQCNNKDCKMYQVIAGDIE